MTTRRLLLKGSAALAAMGSAALFRSRAEALALNTGLADAAAQPKFFEIAPNALDPDFLYAPRGEDVPSYRVVVGRQQTFTGLVDPATGAKLPTTVFGYGPNRRGTAWPGMTFEVKRNRPIQVKWVNKLVDAAGAPLPHLLPVDETYHWAYMLDSMMAKGASIATHGVPIVPHLHGGATAAKFDGHPEAFFNPGSTLVGPEFVNDTYVYENAQPPGTLWYHDHALGITRLNVYAGMAGFYFIRDKIDTGAQSNPLNLPAWPYELAYAIQDRMFRADGRLFYPAFPGDPAYDGFIPPEVQAVLPDPNGLSGLAEFFGDHMCVNGKIWPKAIVEPRQYRLRLLNGCDSRFLILQLRLAGADRTQPTGSPLPFTVIGTDQGFLAAASSQTVLVMGPGERYDVIVDFAGLPRNSRVVLENLGDDAPFMGDIMFDKFPDSQTNLVMAFDVAAPLKQPVRRFDPRSIRGLYAPPMAPSVKTRRLVLFEGTDEFGRILPLLGTLEDGARAWMSPITEKPKLGTTEIWEIINTTADAHPIHLHLVSFEVLGRQALNGADLDAALSMSGSIPVHGGGVIPAPKLDPGGLTPIGTGVPAQPWERGPKDTVTAYPAQITRLKATFGRRGKYAWHCHILSHEDHDMMRQFEVV